MARVPDRKEKTLIAISVKENNEFNAEVSRDTAASNGRRSNYE